MKVNELNAVSLRSSTNDENLDVSESVSKKVTYFYRENIVYPYVNIQETKKGLVLKNDELSEVIYHFQPKYLTSC